MWTDEEEQALARLMATGLERLAAIRLFRRMKGDLKKALKHAKASEKRKEVARQRFKPRFHRQNRPQTNERPIDAPSPRSGRSADIPKRGAR
jgi:hypothetical protein